MFGIGFTEIIVILGIALIVIGPKNLPDMAKALGKGYIEFMKAFREMQRSIEEDVTDIKKTIDPMEEDVDSSESSKRENSADQERTRYNQRNRD